MSQKAVALGAVGLAALIAIVAVAFAMGRRSGAPVATVRATAVAIAPAPQPSPATLPPAAAESPSPPSDDDVMRSVARRMLTLRGPALTEALWAFEQRAGQPPSYAQLERNADRYTGTAAMYSGEVLEIQDLPDQDGAFLRLDLGDSGTRVIAIACMAPPGDDIVRGRHVRVYGMLNGTFTYTSQAGWNITIPKMQAVAVVLNSVPRRPASAGAE